jgi:protein-S-isoprenylcysteine O-methyltransferase Ste14
MVIEIFFILLLISLFSVSAGKYVDSPPLMLGGYTFIFLLGLVLMLGGVEYRTGSVTILSANDTMINTTGTYSNYNGEVFQGLMINHVFGFFMCILSAFGFISQLLNLKTDEVFE